MLSSAGDRDIFSPSSDPQRYPCPRQLLGDHPRRWPGVGPPLKNHKQTHTRKQCHATATAPLARTGAFGLLSGLMSSVIQFNESRASWLPICADAWLCDLPPLLDTSHVGLSRSSCPTDSSELPLDLRHVKIGATGSGTLMAWPNSSEPRLNSWIQDGWPRHPQESPSSHQ